MQKQCKIKYPFCKQPNHASEPLSRLCIDQKCQKKSLICCICEYESHSKHTTIPIKNFINQISAKNQSQSMNTLQFTQELSNLKKQYFENIENCRRTILDELSQLETYGQLYFNRCQQNLSDLITLNQPLSKFADQSSPYFFQRYFKKILQIYSSTEDSNGFSLKNKFNLLINKCKDKEKKVIQNINLLLIQTKKSINKTQDILKESLELGFITIDTIKWSQQYKGAKLKITDNIIEQTNMESSGQRFALADLALPINSKVRWGIKVKKFFGWVGIGICLRNIIKTANYHFNHTNIGHGSYLISSNGYCWSHSIKQSNSVYKTFQFTTNDIVYIQFDPKQNKLRFRKNNGPDKFQLDVAALISGDSYHPCVNLCSTGDSVEMIYPGVPLS